MGVDTKIQWATNSWNPWWGCVRYSEGCVNCYAETLSKRWGHDIWGPGTERRFFGDKHWAEPVKWNREAAGAERRPRVFVASMADVFEQREDLVAPRLRLFELIRATPNLDWLVLTKRTREMRTFLNALAELDGVLPNLWAGTSVENQERANERIWDLEETQAHLRFLSIEPLLGAVDLSPYLHPRSHLTDGRWHDGCAQCLRRRVKGGTGQRIGWVIVGGESGGPPERRLVERCPFRVAGGAYDCGGMPEHCQPDCNGTGWRPKTDALQWVRSIRDQCVGAGIGFTFKQFGGPTHAAGGRELDGRTWDW